VLAVVDFYVSRKYPAPGHAHHGWLTRSFWPAWLALDNVFASSEHVPYLHHHFQTIHFSERRARMRYFPLARVPYYLYKGRRPEE
jgi:S-adenosylmethionine-diacylgycerolhomoserine-N-methlytransferase